MSDKLSWMCRYEGCERKKLTGLDICMSHQMMESKEKRQESQPKSKPKPLQRGYMKPISDKRAEEKARYNARVKVWLVGKMCAVYPNQKATMCHHRWGRENEMLEDENYWLPVSQEGHDFIHNNPIWSREKGFMLLRSVTEKPTI